MKSPSNDYVFCDSLTALENAYELGLPLNAIVLTRSPSILKTLPNLAINLDDRANIDAKKINHFFLETSSSILHLKQTLDNHPHLSQFSILVSREVWNWQQHALFSIFIQENDYVDQRYFVKPDFGDPVLNRRFGFDWSKLFIGAENFQEILSPATACDKFSYEAKTGGYADILALSGGKHFLSKIIDSVSNKFSKRIARGTVHHIRSSELVRDITIKMFFEGWLPNRIIPPSSPPDDTMNPITENIFSLIRGPLNDRWKTISVRPAVDAILQMLEKELNKTNFSF